MIRASLIVPSFNGAGFLPACLDSLLAELGVDDEIIVVDNASTDESRALLSDHYAAKVRVILNEHNLGFAGGCNVGLRAAQGQFLVLVNQDVVVDAGWLEALLAALAPAQVGIAGCKLYYPDGKLQHAGGVLLAPQALPDHRGYRQPDSGQWDRVERVDYVTGAAIAIKRAVIDSIGLFDEGFYPAFYEEVDLCFRARTAGFEVVYSPYASAVHHESTSHEREGTEYHRWMGRGRLRFILKHYSFEQFSEQFAAAERRWLAEQTPPAMREGLRLAYVDVLAALPDMPQAGVLADPVHVNAVAGVLRALADCAAGPAMAAGQPPAPPAEIRQQPRRSISARAASLRARAVNELRDRLAILWPRHRWLEEQAQFNAMLLNQISALQTRVEQIELALEDVDDGLIGVEHTATELKREVAQLADRAAHRAAEVNRTAARR